MSEKPKDYPEDEEGLAVDPPNNTDPVGLSSSDKDPAPVDPPNNT